MFENDFERLKYYYEKKWAQKPQLRQYVAFGVKPRKNMKSSLVRHTKCAMNGP